MSTMRQYFGGSNAGPSKTMRDLGVNDCIFFPMSCERGPFRKGMPQEGPFKLLNTYVPSLKLTWRLKTDG